MKIIEYSNGNRIIKGDRNSLASNIRFNGQGNILYLEDDVRMDESSCLTFNGNNGLAYFGSNIHPYKISLFLHNDTVFHIGRHNYINQNMECFLSEQRHIFIGREGIFSYGIKIVNSDAHVIYSIEDKKRINQSKSVFLGDHVWLGSEVRILKGLQMHSGSFIGQNSVASGKNIKSNEIWGGNPAKIIKKGIFWSWQCVHNYDAKESQKMQYMYDEKYIYDFDDNQYISFDEINEKLSSLMDIDDKLKYLLWLDSIDGKNRFSMK